jgi:hypothetical protein
VVTSELGDADDGTCGKAFSTKQRLELHERTHRNKPRCQELVPDGNGGFRRCAAVFRKEGTLAAHVDKVHKGVKPFVCEQMVESRDEEGRQGERVCGMGYDTRGKLNEHTRRNHGEARRKKRFICGMCTASDSTGMDVEMGNDEINVVAPPMAFSTLAELSLHNRLFHPKQPQNSHGGARNFKKNPPEPRLKPKVRSNQHTQRLQNESAADWLTGTVEATNASIPCLRSDCSLVFSTELELGTHCSDVHFMAEVEVAEGLREREALAGGVFWLGGQPDGVGWLDEDDEFDGLDYFGSTETAGQEDLAIDPKLEALNLMDLS